MLTQRTVSLIIKSQLHISKIYLMHLWISWYFLLRIYFFLLTLLMKVTFTVLHFFSSNLLSIHTFALKAKGLLTVRFYIIVIFIIWLSNETHSTAG